MKTELNISAKQLGVLVFHFNDLEKQPLHTRQGKVAQSILYKLNLKFKKKYMEVVHQPNKTKRNKVKKYKFSFDYHEAHYLEGFITIVETKAMSEYDRNVLNLIKSTLNQQLA
jgi:hypothetical protein